MTSEKKLSLELAAGALPAPSSASPNGLKATAHRRRVVPALGLLALVGLASRLIPDSTLSACDFPSTVSSSSSELDGFLSGPVDPASLPTCRQASIAPVPANETGRGDVFYSPAFAKKEVERFLGAIRIPTEISDDMATADVWHDARFSPFLDLHTYLETTYPLLHAAAKIEKVNRLGLVYTLEGAKANLKPVMLTAHQDVVPAQTSLDRWTHPPFEGVFDGTTVWGRGSTDCKNSLTGVMSALEHLLERGWRPTRTIVLAFGFDEEIGGPQGAATIFPFLLERYGKDGIAFIVDEGGSGVSEEYGKTFILPGTGEKGNVSPQIEVRTEGGHSSIPRPHTAIGLLSRIVASIEDQNLFPPTLHTSSPIYAYLSCIQTHGKPSLVPGWLTDGLKGKQTQKALDKLASSFAAVRGRVYGEFLVRTSKAVTLIGGGHKLNALPESASATFNSRIDFSQTPKQVMDIYSSALLPFARSFNLSLAAWDEPSRVLHTGTEGSIWLTVSGEAGLAPAPITRLEGSAFDVFSWASQRVFGKGGREADVVVSPSAATGNTDTKHYWDLTRAIYRFVPRRVDTSFGAHTVDERTLLRTHLETVEWYHELVLFADAIENDDGF